ncbi:hypothetical protein NPIL_475071 [Nephila pilipes]|uniref:Uncharacterized protein n=1 Tax=Nephila pilipes TaxID=299642 RepID=A0A8X6TY98_NEPPI|nr:hypothetical protein NPIL_475071 [Nephila pilipes]
MANIRGPATFARDPRQRCIMIPIHCHRRLLVSKATKCVDFSRGLILMLSQPACVSEEDMKKLRRYSGGLGVSYIILGGVVHRGII